MTSCTPIQSAPTLSAQAMKPLLAAERMPFRFRVTSRNKKDSHSMNPSPATDTLAQDFVAFAVECRGVALR